jgi:iron complex outermembrane receptor protein
MVEVRKSACRLSSVIALALCSQTAWAGEAMDDATAATAAAEGEAPSGPARDEDIVVTASKSGSTLLSRTAVTANVMSADALAERQISNVSDLQTQVPGFVLDTGSSVPKLTIRGVGLDQIGAGSENGVALYLDGVLIGRAAAALGGYNDLESVQVLKGPQGTSFGRNATGGAINYITQKPVEGYGGYVNLQYGSFDRIRGGAALNYGGERFGVRLSGYYHYEKGFVDNVTTGSRLNGARVYTIRGVAEWRPSDSLSFEYLFDYSNNEYQFAQATNSNPAASIATTIAAQFAAAGRPVPTPLQLGRNKQYQVVADTDPLNRTKVMTNALTATLDLGAVSLKSITAAVDTDVHYRVDVDNSAIPIIAAELDLQSKQFSQELNLIAELGKLKLVVGGYYLHEKVDQPQVIGFFDRIAPTGIIRVLNPTQKLNSYAGFAEGVFSISDDIRLTGGIRYTKDKKDITLRGSITTGPLSPTPGVTTILCNLQVGNRWSKVTYSAGIEADIADNLFGYAKVGRGFKAGGFNDGACPNSYDPETITSYEAGLKGNLLDRKLTFALSGFYSDYGNIQLTVVRPGAGGTTTNTTENAAKARIWGFDLQTRVEPVPGFSFDAAASWLPTAEYTNYDSITPRDPTGAICVRRSATLTNGCDLSGNRLNRAPEFSATFGLNYTHEFGSGNSLTARAEVYRTSEIVYSAFEYPDAVEPGYTLLNAYITAELDSGLTLRLYGKNLTDKLYLTGLYPNSPPTSVTPGYFGRPREFGVEVNAKF